MAGPDDAATGSVRDDLERAFSEAASKAPNEPAATADDNAAPAALAAPSDAADSDKPKAVAKDDVAADKGDKARASRVEPPVRWTPEEKESWDKMIEDLPPELAGKVTKIQSILVGRNKSMESEFTRQMQSIATDRQRLGEYDKIISKERREQWARGGLTETRAIAELLDGFDRSNKDPIGFIKWIADMRGVDLARAFGAPPQQQRTAANDDNEGVTLHPAVQRRLDEYSQHNQALQGELQRLQQAQQQLGGHISAQQQQQQRELHSSVTTEMEAFSSEADGHGAPKHPFFDELRNDMGTLLATGQAHSLADAYDRAAYANPSIRARLLESQQLAQRREWERKAADDARRSRAAGGSIPPGGPTVSTAQGGAAAPVDSVRGTIEHAIEAQLRRAGGRI